MPLPPFFPPPPPPPPDLLALERASKDGGGGGGACEGGTFGGAAASVLDREGAVAQAVAEAAEEEAEGPEGFVEPAAGGARGGIVERSGADLSALKASSTRAPPSGLLLIFRMPPNRVYRDGPKIIFNKNCTGMINRVKGNNSDPRTMKRLTMHRPRPISSLVEPVRGLLNFSSCAERDRNRQAADHTIIKQGDATSSPPYLSLSDLPP